jgi:plasmid segregation protein ParM
MMDESWGVIEVGYYSTDFMLMQRGRWVEKASGSCAGVRVAADHLARMLAEKGLTVDLPECEEALQTRRILDFGRKTDVGHEVDQSVALVVTEVIDTATRLMEPYVRKLDGVLVAGGGAPIVHPRIQEKWPHAHMANKPRLAVAEGMRRFGMALLRARELQGVNT